MTEADLNVVQSDSLIQEFGGKGVSQCVWIHSLLDPSRLAKPLEEVTDIDRLNRLSEIHFRDTAEDRRVPNAIDSDLLSFRHPQIQIQLGLGV